MIPVQQKPVNQLSAKTCSVPWKAGLENTVLKVHSNMMKIFLHTFYFNSFFLSAYPTANQTGEDINSSSLQRDKTSEAEKQTGGETAEVRCISHSNTSQFGFGDISLGASASEQTSVSFNPSPRSVQVNSHSNKQHVSRANPLMLQKPQTQKTCRK